ncbi:MAG: CAP domain-containing protein [Lachnospiraceae bacterium]|nr:CAP domain-containing protein [Lachnospiraceae bacterium]
MGFKTRSSIIKIILLLFILLCLPTMIAQAKSNKKKTKTIKAAIVMKKGSSRTLSAGKKKAKWTVSNKKIIKLKTKKGKKKAVIKALKPGKATVTAKIGKKKYKWIITVKKIKLQSVGAEPVDQTYYVNTGQEVIGHFDTAMAQDLFDAINAYREQEGKNTLRSKGVLTEAANVRSIEIVVLFSHTRPNGKEYYTVDGTAGCNYKDSALYGENLAYGFNNAREVLDAWKISPSQNAVLLRESFITMGVSVIAAKQSDGSYCKYIVVVFGS